MKHLPVKMLMADKYPRKHTYMTGRRGNVWHGVWKCGTCKAEKRALCNPMRGRVFMCGGDETWTEKRAEQIADASAPASPKQEDK